jgi:hypothetical protein
MPEEDGKSKSFTLQRLDLVKHRREVHSSSGQIQVSELPSLETIGIWAMLDIDVFSTIQAPS